MHVSRALTHGVCYFVDDFMMTACTSEDVTRIIKESAAEPVIIKKSVSWNEDLVQERLFTPSPAELDFLASQPRPPHMQKR